tara:strand:- start:2354 stop:2557 length:204 start_codon:yes stop_codon:yes gene_type:complete
MEKNSWYKVREISYQSMIGSHLDPKKLPKSQEKYMSLEGKKESVNSVMLERMRKAREDYLKTKENGE